MKKAINLTLAALITITSATAFAKVTMAEVSSRLSSKRENRENDPVYRETQSSLRDSNITNRKNNYNSEISRIDSSIDSGKLMSLASRRISVKFGEKSAEVTGEKILLDLFAEAREIKNEREELNRKGELTPEISAELDSRQNTIKASLEYLETLSNMSDSNSSLSADAQQYVSHALKQAALTTRLNSMSKADRQMHLDAMATVVKISNESMKSAEQKGLAPVAVAAAGRADVAFRAMMEARNNGDAAKAREASKKVTDCE